MTKSTVTVSVLSDLHAYDDSSSRPSHLNITEPEEPGRHPIAGLLHLISDSALTADMVVCPGDLGHKARPAAIQYAWGAVHRVGHALGADVIAATPGNHDLDSRYAYNGFDAKGVLQALTPSYPVPDEAACDRFWSRHFVSVEREHYRLVLMNSCAFHGQGAEPNASQKELDHGRISEHTLAKLKDHLATLAPKPVNILVCHHHPQQHMELRLGDYDVMSHGQLLLDLLGGGRYGEWLLIHGHKHHPKLTYASGGAVAPIVFSTGSLCAELYLELQTRARNQFYMVEFRLEDIDSIGLCGVIRAWDWASGMGWIPAGANSGLPALAGFGYRGNVKLLAREIAGSQTTQTRSWTDAVHTHSGLEYLLPSDHELLRAELQRVGVGINLAADGTPLDLYRSS